MKAKTIRICSIIGKAAAVISGGAAYLELLPPQYAAYGAVLFGIVSIAKDAAISAGDLADDGIRNNSFRP
jgi:uncharacterized protein involved in exopolysaccharide biosynthesis